MNSRDAQDVILRLLADGPFRATAPESNAAVGPEVAAIVSKVDLAGLDRFGLFLCRHYYRERVVHYFKYSRALTPLTQRAPEGALKTAEFAALMPKLILGDRSSAQAVLELLRRFLTADAGSIRGAIPYWDDLIAYQGAFFLSDALPAQSSARFPSLVTRVPGPEADVRPAGARRFPARAETATILELNYDLPPILPYLLRPFTQVPMPLERATRLLFTRSEHGEVTVVRCSDALKNLLDSLTGQEDPSQVAARMGLDAASLDRALRQLEQLGAVVAQGSFSSSHVGSDLPPAR